MRAVGDLGQRLGAGAEIVVSIGEVFILADQGDGKLALALAGALQNTGSEHRRFMARIGADQKNRVGLIDAGDGGIEEVGGATESRIELGAVLAAIDVRRAELLSETL